MPDAGTDELDRGRFAPRSAKHPVEQFVAIQAEMVADIFQDVGQGADFDRIVIGHRDMVFAVLLSRDPNVRAFLASDDVTQLLESFGKIGSRERAGNFMARALPRGQNAGE